MSDVMAMDGFEGLLVGVLRERISVATPRGLEQRLMARLAQESVALSRVEVRPFAFAERVAVRRGSASTWFAVGAHAAVLLVLLGLASRRVMTHEIDLKQVALVDRVELPPVRPRMEAMGGGGGQHDLGPVTQGRLPKLAQVQLVAPKAPPMIAPKLAVEPSVVVQPDLKMATNSMPSIGAPNSSLKGFSMGDGSGSGLGSGFGNGMGPGSGGNVGSGLFHVGGGVLAPVVITAVDPEFSEEARKAKFSGSVEVYLIVDEMGRPVNVRVARGVGMGLDEKAVEAVKQYRFKPAMRNGKPVKVDLYVDVNFAIF